VWTTESDGSAAKAESLHLAERLTAEIVAAGLIPDQQVWPSIRERVKRHGADEWYRLASYRLSSVEPASAQKLLGAGYVLTQFLTAPVNTENSGRNAIYSAGALINLAVVVCDRLLDGGASVQEVLPGPGSEVRSPVYVLMERYRETIAGMSGHEQPGNKLEKAIARMFDAEVETVHYGMSLPYRFWLRKSALPFVLMGSTAWLLNKGETRAAFSRHLKWLYEVGRFFGALDDVVDYADDIENTAANILRGHEEGARTALVKRMAKRAVRVLDEWDSVVPRITGFAVMRESFLFFIWSWLAKADVQADAQQWQAS